ncbi:unnamed protein product [Symbiodinium sp. CCMP2592]|nr:unnamed protein product [Symbiodinium sp. CCMP2592]
MHGTSLKPHAPNSFLNGNPTAQGLDVSPYEDVIPSPGSTSRPLALELATGQKLRATCLYHTLESFGFHFAVSSLATASFTIEQADKLYLKSYDTENVQVFISHCWRDKRFPKLVALWIRFNLYPALLCSSIVGAVVFVASLSKQREEADEMMTPSVLLAGVCTFFVSLAFWHHVPFRLGCRKSSLFFDKLCVYQYESDLRQQGIDSFAAYIAKCDEILVLWSPEYFTRLWCTLEMAALVKTHADSGKLPLYFMPLGLAKAAFLSWITVALLCVARELQLLLDTFYFLADAVVLTPILILNALIFGLAIDRYAQARRSLTKQLETFDVRESRCAFESDRETVYHTIREWFTDLDGFNNNVRLHVRDHVASSLGWEFHFPKRLTFPPMLFSIFSQLDSIAAGDFEHQTMFKIFAFIADIARLGALIPIFILLSYCFAKMGRRWLAFILFMICALCFQMFLTFGEQVLHEGTPVWLCVLEVSSQWMTYFLTVKASWIADAVLSRCILGG